MHLTRVQKIMNVMLAEPEREWTPAEVSVKLGIAPKLTGEPMRKMFNRGELIRTQPGRYRIPTRAERAAYARAQETATVVVDIPAPVPVPAPPITEHERIIMLRTLRNQGRPMAPALIAGRLSKCGFRLARTEELLAFLEQEQAVRRLDDGRWELVA